MVQITTYQLIFLLSGVLAYYTGFVYEAFEAIGEGRALAGGGRYDHLVKKLSGNSDMPAQVVCDWRYDSK